MKDGVAMTWKDRPKVGLDTPIRHMAWDCFAKDAKLMSLVNVAANLKKTVFNYREKKQHLLSHGFVKDQIGRVTYREYFYIPDYMLVLEELCGQPVVGESCLYPDWDKTKVGSSIIFGIGVIDRVGRQGVVPGFFHNILSLENLRRMRFTPTVVHTFSLAKSEPSRSIFDKELRELHK